MNTVSRGVEIQFELTGAGAASQLGDVGRNLEYIETVGRRTSTSLEGAARSITQLDREMQGYVKTSSGVLVPRGFTDLPKQAEEAGRAVEVVGTKVKRELGTMGTAMEHFQRSIRNYLLGAASIYAVQRIAEIGFEVAKTRTQMAMSFEVFQRYGYGLGEIARLRAATYGTISDVGLTATASRASQFLIGMGETPGQAFETISTVGRYATAQALIRGEDPAETFERMVSAVVHARPELLNNYGLIVQAVADLGDEYDNTARTMQRIGGITEQMDVWLAKNESAISSNVGMVNRLGAAWMNVKAGTAPTAPGQGGPSLWAEISQPYREAWNSFWGFGERPSAAPGVFAGFPGAPGAMYQEQGYYSTGWRSGAAAPGGADIGVPPIARIPRRPVTNVYGGEEPGLLPLPDWVSSGPPAWEYPYGTLYPQGPVALPTVPPRGGMKRFLGTWGSEDRQIRGEGPPTHYTGFGEAYRAGIMGPTGGLAETLGTEMGGAIRGAAVNLILAGPAALLTEAGSRLVGAAGRLFDSGRAQLEAAHEMKNAQRQGTLGGLAGISRWAGMPGADRLAGEAAFTPLSQGGFGGGANLRAAYDILTHGGSALEAAQRVKANPMELMYAAIRSGPEVTDPILQWVQAVLENTDALRGMTGMLEDQLGIARQRYNAVTLYEQARSDAARDIVVAIATGSGILPGGSPSSGAPGGGDALPPGEGGGGGGPSPIYDDQGNVISGGGSESGVGTYEPVTKPGRRAEAARGQVTLNIKINDRFVGTALANAVASGEVVIDVDADSGRARVTRR